MESRGGVLEYVYWLMGSGRKPAGELGPGERARALAYMSRRRYHRVRFMGELASCFNPGSPPLLREVAWVLIQEVKLSHLVALAYVGVPSSRSLRLAVASRIGRASLGEVVSAYMFGPSGWRRMWRALRLPVRYVDGREIRNQPYRLAASLGVGELSARGLVERFGVLGLARMGAPIHTLLQYVSSPDEAEELAKMADPLFFLEHLRWFLNVLGEDAGAEVAIEKVRDMSDPLKLWSIVEHLGRKGVPGRVLEELERRLGGAVEEILRRAGLRRIILVVDVSGSMESAVTITRNIYPLLSRLAGAVDIVAFNENAWTVDPRELPHLRCGGATSVGSGLMRAAGLLGNDVDAVVLISDLGENTPPLAREVAPRIPVDIPLVVVRVGSRRRIRFGRPYTLIDLRDFHPRMAGQVLAMIIEAIGRDAEVTETRPLEEEILSTPLPRRPEETMRPGYLKRLLAGGG